MSTVRCPGSNKSTSSCRPTRRSSGWRRPSYCQQSRSRRTWSRVLGRLSEDTVSRAVRRWGRASDVDPDTYSLQPDEWFLSQIGPVRSAVLDGTSKKELAYDARGPLAQSQYHFLWPNITININPGLPNLSIDVWNPDGPQRARGFSEQYFGANVPEDFAREMMAFDDQVGAEDDALTDSVQRGLRAGIPAQGRFLPESEQLVIRFQRMVLSALS